LRPARLCWLAVFVPAIALCLAPAVPAEEPPFLDFVLHTADGPRAPAPLSKVGEDWSVRLGGQKPALVPGADVVALRRHGLPLPAFPTGEQLVLAGGDRLPLDPGGDLRLADDVLTVTPLPPVRAAGGGGLRVPVARAAVLWLAAPSGTARPGALLRKLAAGKREADVVLLRNGDAVEGTLLGLARGKDCEVKAGKQVRRLPFAQVAAVALNTELQAVPKFKGPYGLLVVRNGARLSLLSARLTADGKALEGKAAFGPAVTVPLAQAAALDVRLGRAVYLSDLRPEEYTHKPFLGIDWPLVRDGSAAGGEIRLEGSTFDKGLGTHAESAVTYDLCGKYAWFVAVVGLDGRTGKRGGRASRCWWTARRRTWAARRC
jgi:hypothetical protein